MKKRGLILFLLGAHWAEAQEPWVWSQYMFNLYEANIAYAGNPEALYVSAHHRIQWAGWEGAPKMSNAILQAPILGGKMGIGLTAQTERIGAHKSSGGEAAMAYKLRLGDGLLSFALSAGISQQTFFPNQIAVRDEEAWLPEAFFTNSVVARFGAGVFFNTKRFFAGADAKNLNRPTEKAYPGAIGRDFREYRTVVGGVISLNKEWSFRPSGMLRFRDSGRLSADVSACFFWKEKIWVGMSWRPLYGWAGMADWSVSRRLRIGYSADLAMGRVRFLPPSHEVFMGYYFNLGANRPPSIRYF